MSIRLCGMLLLLCLPVLLAAKAPYGPSITRDRAGTPIIVLSVAMRDAIRRYAPSFTPCAFDHYAPSLRAHYQLTSRQIPSAVIGDFNGDRHPDVALQGHTKACFGIIVLLSRGRGYRVVAWQMGEQSDPKKEDTSLNGSVVESGHISNLLYAPSGRYQSPYEPGPAHVRHAAFSIDVYEKATVLIYYAGGRFHAYQTAD